MSAAAVATMESSPAAATSAVLEEEEEEKKESLSSTNSKTNREEGDDDDDNGEQQQHAVSVREVAELAAGAAHRKSLDSLDEHRESLLKNRQSNSNTSQMLTPSRQLSRRKSSGPPRTSSSGLRAMSRSLGERGAPTISGRSSGGSRSMLLSSGGHRRGIDRSQSSDMSSMRMMMAANGGGGTTRSSFSSRGGGGSGLIRESSVLSGGAEPVRGVRRAQSMSVSSSSRSGMGGGGARLAPDRRGLGRSDSARGVPSRRGVGRTCSQNSLNHMSQNAGGGGGGGAEDGAAGVRPYRGRDGLVNMSIGVPNRSDSGQDFLRRDDRSVGEMSNFTMATMDSVNLRKQQIVADPLDDAATYREQDSYADHESVYTMATNDLEGMGGYEEILPQEDPNHVPYDGVSVADTIGSMDEYGAMNQQNMRLLDEATDHSRPNHIACDTVSLSTIGGEMEEGLESETESYLGIGEEDEDYESTIREEDEDEESSKLEPSGKKEEEGGNPDVPQKSE